MNKAKHYLGRLCAVLVSVSIPFIVVEIVAGNALKKRVLADKGTDGKFPSVFPYLQLIFGEQIVIDGRKATSLGGVSETLTTLGGGITYTSDRHGFNNPDEVWDSDAPTVLIGDSYVQGYVVQTEDTMAGVMRTQGVNTLGLGMGGNGPLIELATVVELAEPLEPRSVYWMYYEGNDLQNYKREDVHPELLAYLDGGEPVGLSHHQATIDDALRGYVQRERDALAPLWVRLVRLTETRRLARRALTSLRDAPAVEPVVKIKPKAGAKELGNVVEEAQRRLQCDLVFVYLPSWARLNGEADVTEMRTVLSEIEGRGIRTLNATEWMRAETENPASECYPSPKGHFSETGYRLVAEMLLEDLQHLRE